MSELNFYKPQRQSAVGILLIFSTAVFQLVRNFWVVGVYFFVQKVDEEVILYSILGFVVILLLTLVYSVLSYLRFRFYIAEDKGEFVLEKGVFSSEVVSIPTRISRKIRITEEATSITNRSGLGSSSLVNCSCSRREK